MTGKPQIAVIDDDESIRSGLSSLLRAEGFAVQLYDCAEAFLARGTTGPACIITDIQMPGISGLELQARLAVEAPGLPVLVMTAFPDASLRARALAAGAVCFLDKPFEAEDLLGCIRQALEDRG